MRRGFKAQCERDALDIRTELGFDHLSAFQPELYAEHLGISVKCPGDFDISESDLAQLTIKDVKGWSALTIRIGSHSVIVLNSGQSKRRQKTSLMHEIAHIKLNHVGSRVDEHNGLLLVSDYSKEKEEEADWFGGAILAPKPALTKRRFAGMSPAEIAQDLEISNDLCTWRLQMTGVERQLSYRKNRYD